MVYNAVLILDIVMSSSDMPDATTKIRCLVIAKTCSAQCRVWSARTVKRQFRGHSSLYSPRTKSCGKVDAHEHETTLACLSSVQLILGINDVVVQAGAAGELSSPDSTLCADSYSVSVPPHVAAVARKRPGSFCQKCRLQVTPKHAYSLDPTRSEWADYAAVQA